MLTRLTLCTLVLSTLVSGLPISSSTLAAQESSAMVSVPQDWRSGIPDGSTRYRCRVRIPAEWEQHRLDLFLEGIDDAREAFINGTSIARLGDFPPQYRSGLGATGRYEVPREAIRFGEWNEIQVLIHRRGGRQNFNVAAPALFTETQAIHLSGSWQKSLGDAADPSPVPDKASFDSIEAAGDVAARLQQLEGDRGSLPPAEAATTMLAGEGLQVTQVLADPIIGQPLALRWDHRGRLWIAEYRQYPHPAGLKPVSRDTFLRTVYDRVPPAPPHHDRGADRISIHEDSDGDGIYDSHRVFVDGLNLATSFAIGRGGVFVLNPPYLLFYPDQDQDDVPDNDPTVLLEGFGIEDSHSIANSLRWGPDGWLYAAQGSTVSAKIRAPGSTEPTIDSVGQAIWRYHPETHRYEVFAEGGGNAFGVEIDASGQIFSGHNGGDTRGFHYVQGAYLQKGFSKHGELSNPYAFGYFSWMTHHAVPRFTHTFVIEQGGMFPAPWAGRLFGVEPLQGRVVMSDVRREQSTYATTDVGYALTSTDSWFRPVDIQTGPDGALYVADMHEQRIDHGSHYQGRVTPETGRIYRLAPQTPLPLPTWNLETSAGCLQALSHPNRWVRQTSLVRIFDAPDKTDAAALRASLTDQDAPYAIDHYWALLASGQANLQDQKLALQHTSADVRLWAVRLAADTSSPKPEWVEAIVLRAAEEPDPQVRAQMAATAKRLTPAIRVRLIETLVAHHHDQNDPHVPLLLWWALEATCREAPESVVNVATLPSVQASETARKHLLPKLMRRFTITGRRDDLLRAAQLLEKTSDPEVAQALLEGFDAATAGRTLASIPEPLAKQLARFRGDSLELQILLGKPEAIQTARVRVADESLALPERLRLIELLDAQESPVDVDAWLQLLSSSNQPAIRIATIAALTDADDSRIADQLLKLWPQLDVQEQLVAQTTLASRQEWSQVLVNAVAAGHITATAISADAVRRMGYHDSPDLQRRLTELWPQVHADLPQEIDTAAIAQLRDRILGGDGNPYDGRARYTERCGQCHRLFGAGGELGPDLTSYHRTDLDRLLANVLAPSLELREGYRTRVVETDDGLVLTGFVESQDEQALVLRQADGRAVTIPTDSILDLYDSQISLMPAGLLNDLDDQQLRDLFAYLRSAQPLP